MRARFRSFIDELVRRKVVTTAVWYLGVAFISMQVVDAVFPYLPFRDPDAAGRMVLMVLTLGFPIVLGASWALDLVPPKLRREAPGPSKREVGEAPTPRPDSVAVLPFDNLSDATENEYFSDGITDDIIASVAHVGGLRVISRTSVMQYKGLNRHVRDIAHELGVGTVVTGSVRRSDSRIRIFAEVVDALSDDHLWSGTYDRELRDIFQVQSEVAAHIAEAVHRELTAADRSRIEARGTDDPKAYDLYLRARALWNRRTEASVAESIRYFERALEYDVDFALALSGLADAHVVLAIYGARPPRDALAEARAAANKALSIEPGLGEAVAADACVSAILDWSWDEADTRFREAVRLAPSYATAHQWHALHALVPRGRGQEALELLDTARELDPASGAIAVSRGIVAFYTVDLEAARGEFEAVVQRHPDFPLAHFFLGQCLARTGDVARGLTALQKAARMADDSSETLAALGHLHARNGDIGAAENILDRLRRRARRSYVSPTMAGQVLIGLGRLDQAMTRLEEAADVRASDLVWLGVHPVYEPLRGRLRFKALLQRLGLERGAE